MVINLHALIKCLSVYVALYNFLIFFFFLILFLFLLSLFILFLFKIGLILPFARTNKCSGAPTYQWTHHASDHVLVPRGGPI